MYVNYPNVKGILCEQIAALLAENPFLDGSLENVLKQTGHDVPEPYARQGIRNLVMYKVMLQNERNIGDFIAFTKRIIPVAPLQSMKQIGEEGYVDFCATIRMSFVQAVHKQLRERGQLWVPDYLFAEENKVKELTRFLLPHAVEYNDEFALTQPRRL